METNPPECSLWLTESSPFCLVRCQLPSHGHVYFQFFWMVLPSASGSEHVLVCILWDVWGNHCRHGQFSVWAGLSSQGLCFRNTGCLDSPKSLPMLAHPISWDGFPWTAFCKFSPGSDNWVTVTTAVAGFHGSPSLTDCCLVFNMWLLCVFYPFFVLCLQKMIVHGVILHSLSFILLFFN